MRRKSIELGINGPCDDLTAHIFRHNYACMLMFAGVEMKERQYLLGHKTITMTYNIYTHIEVDKMMAASKLRTYLGDFDENRIPDYLRNNIDATCNNIISV